MPPLRSTVRALTASLLLAVACPAGATPPPEFSKAVTTSADDAADRYTALIEHFQPANGRDAGAANAWTMLVEAGAIFHEVDRRVWRDPKAGVTDAYPDFAVIYDPPAAPSDQDKRNLAISLKVIDECRAAGLFDKLAAAAHTPRAARPRIDSEAYRKAGVSLGAATADEKWDGRLVSILLPELGSTRALARLNAAVMQQAASAKDARAFINSFEQTLALARVCAHQPALIDRLVADAVAALAADRATKTIRAGAWPDAALLDGLDAALERQTKWPSIRLQFEGERLLALDACRWAFDADGRPDPRAFSTLGSMSNQPLDFTKFSGPLATRDDTVKALNEYFDKLATAQAPSAARRAAVAVELSTLLGDLPHGQLLVPMLVSVQHKGLEADARTDARLALLRVTIALEKHKLRAGEYPAVLTELAPGIDVNDPWTDRPLRYNKTAAGYELSSAEADPHK